MTPDSAFGRQLAILLAALTGAFAGMGAGFMLISPTYLVDQWAILVLLAAAGAALAVAAVYAAIWRWG